MQIDGSAIFEEQDILVLNTSFAYACADPMTGDDGVITRNQDRSGKAKCLNAGGDLANLKF